MGAHRGGRPRDCEGLSNNRVITTHERYCVTGYCVPMGMSNAERQAEYRRRNQRAGLDPDLIDREPTARINTVVDVDAAAALGRLAAYHGLTKRAMLEELIRQPERDLVARYEVAAGDYFAVTA